MSKSLGKIQNQIKVIQEIIEEFNSNNTLMVTHLELKKQEEQLRKFNAEDYKLHNPKGTTGMDNRRTI